MKAIDELREYASECCPEYEPYDSRMMRIADEIEAEVAEGYMRLPRDVDGEPINVGDRITLPRGEETTVQFVAPDCVLPASPVSYYMAVGCRRVKPDPLNELLHDACMNATRICCEQGVGTNIRIEVDDTELGKFAERIRELMGGSR